MAERGWVCALQIPLDLGDAFPHLENPHVTLSPASNLARHERDQLWRAQGAALSGVLRPFHLELVASPNYLRFPSKNVPGKVFLGLAVKLTPAFCALLDAVEGVLDDSGLEKLSENHVYHVSLSVEGSTQSPLPPTNEVPRRLLVDRIAVAGSAKTDLLVYL